jgi:hypothetical protein
LDIPYNLEQKNSGILQEEELAKRYGVTIRTNDMKNIVGGGNFSDRVMTFFTNFLNEKKGVIDKVFNSYAFDQETTSSLSLQNVGSRRFAFEKAHKMIEDKLKIKNGFKTLKRAFFIAKFPNSRFYLIEYLRDFRNPEVKKNKSMSPLFETY